MDQRSLLANLLLDAILRPIHILNLRLLEDELELPIEVHKILIIHQPILMHLVPLDNLTANSQSSQCMEVIQHKSILLTQSISIMVLIEIIYRGQ